MLYRPGKGEVSGLGLLLTHACLPSPVLGLTQLQLPSDWRPPHGDTAPSATTGALGDVAQSHSRRPSPPAPEGIRGLQLWSLIHQNGPFVRTSSSGFVPTVPFSKFMKTKMLPQFQCNFAWRQWLSFLSAFFNGEGRAGHVSLHKCHNRHIPSALNLKGGSEKHLT